MDIKLPLVVVHRGRRLIEAWVPGLDAVHAVGPSLSEMRDDLALKVMELFEFATPARFGAYQLPPHVSLRMVDVDVVAQDRVKKKRVPLEGRLGVLLEKWPDDTFYVVTPTRIPSARFALRSPDDLDSALNRRIAAWALEQNVQSLAPWSSDRRERLDILEVDADPPSIFPKGPKRYLRRPKKKSAAGAPRETEREKDERRRMRRLSVQTLRTIARNLSHGARDDSLDRAFGREALVKTLVDDFDLREGNAVVLVGESGSGKTAVVHEFVRRLSERYQSHDLRRDVWRVDGNRFIAGMMYVGQWEERARSLIDELIDLGDVLYIDDLASMVYAGRTNKQDTHVAQFLEPHLARGELTVLAESTPERFERVREEAPTFASLFRVVRVDALSDRETLPVLLGVLRDLESDAEGYVTPVRVTPDALETVLALTRRFLAHEAYPGKAVRLVRSVLSTPGTVRDGYRWYEARDVFDAFKRLTGLPDFILGAEPPRTRESIRASLGAMVAGQPEAIEAVTDVVVTMQRSLSDPEKPLATYLFVGPTGVGKTETARALATYLFGSPSRMVRFDMSEFASSVSVTRLVGHAGAPDGELALSLRTQPFTVVLFDEIEKAHPRVFDALLQLFGEGRLTDAAGRTADARMAVLIMTSNLGVREATVRTGFAREGGDTARTHYLAAVRQFFRPEFFNRIDRVVPFVPLDRAALRVVVEHALKGLLSRRGVRRGNVLVDVEPELLDALVEQAYDPRYGARPLRRALERELAVPLAHHLVRRRSNDLTWVRLYRESGALGLHVCALRDAAPLPIVMDPSSWGTRGVVERFRATRDRLRELLGSPEVERLMDVRTLALRAMQKGAAAVDRPELDLLERLRELAEEFERIEEENPLGIDYIIEEVHPTKKALLTNVSWKYDHAARIQKRGSGLVETPVQGRQEAEAQKLRPRVANLMDAVEVLDHTVRAFARGEDRPGFLLIEPVTQHDPELTRSNLHQLANPLAWVVGGPVYNEYVQGDTTHWSTEPPSNKDPLPLYRRACVAIREPGASAFADHFTGYAIIPTPSGRGGAEVCLLRVVRLEGERLEETVRAYDASDAAKEALTQREVTVGWRGDASRGTITHAPTGLPSNGWARSLVAAVLRALRHEAGEAEP